MLSGRDRQVDIDLGLTVGADDYLIKPFHPAELVRRVRWLLLATGLCALLATGYLMKRPRWRTGVPGVLAGIGTPLLVLAYLNRGGPGLVCQGEACRQHLSPWPWLLAGVLFVLLGVAGQLLSGYAGWSGRRGR